MKYIKLSFLYTAWFMLFVTAFTFGIMKHVIDFLGMASSVAMDFVKEEADKLRLEVKP